jgi:hypothetical protein
MFSEKGNAVERPGVGPAGGDKGGSVRMHTRRACSVYESNLVNTAGVSVPWLEAERCSEASHLGPRTASASNGLLISNVATY